MTSPIPPRSNRVAGLFPLQSPAMRGERPLTPHQFIIDPMRLPFGTGQLSAESQSLVTDVLGTHHGDIDRMQLLTRCIERVGPPPLSLS